MPFSVPTTHPLAVRDKLIWLWTAAGVACSDGNEAVLHPAPIVLITDVYRLP